MGWPRSSEWSRLSIPFLLLVASLTFGASSGQSVNPGPYRAGGYNGQGPGPWNRQANGRNGWSGSDGRNYGGGVDQTNSVASASAVAVSNSGQNYGRSGGRAFSAASSAADSDGQSSDAAASAAAASYGANGNQQPRGWRRKTNQSYSKPPAPDAGSWTPGGTSARSWMSKNAMSTLNDCIARSKSQTSQNRIEYLAKQMQSGGYNMDSMSKAAVTDYKTVSTTYPDMSCVGAAVQTGVDMCSAGYYLLKTSPYGCIVDLIFSIDYLYYMFIVFDYFGCDNLCMASWFSQSWL